MKNKIIAVLVILLTVAGCKTVKTVYVPTNTVHTEYVTIHDTVVSVKLDVIRDSIVSKDTLSTLDNKYAKTTAKWSNGMLYHSLSTKNVEIPIKIQYINTATTDTIQVPYKVDVIREVKKPLGWYEKLSVWGFSILIVIVVIIILVKLNGVFNVIKV